jgi:hypothetical protein
LRLGPNLDEQTHRAFEIIELTFGGRRSGRWRGLELVATGPRRLMANNRRINWSGGREAILGAKELCCQTRHGPCGPAPA